MYRDFIKTTIFICWLVCPTFSVADTCISTIAGIGTAGLFPGDGSPALTTPLKNPVGVALDNAGNIYIAELTGCRLLKMDASGLLWNVAGTGGSVPNGDGGAATLANYSGRNLAVDGSGNIYIADSYNHRVRKVDAATGIITTIAGNGTFGMSGDGGPATAAQIYYPSDVALDSAGNVFFTDYHNARICKVDTSGVISTFLTTTYTPFSLSIDASDNIYYLDGNSALKYTHATGLTETTAGCPFYGYAGDGGPATAALFYGPTGISADNAGNVYIADEGNHRIRRVDAVTKIIETVVGSAAHGYLGDGGQATLCGLFLPNGVKVDPTGNLYIADTYNVVIRKVQPCDPAWTPSFSPTVFISSTVTGTPTPTTTPSETPTFSDSPTPSDTATISLTPTISPNYTATDTKTLTPSATPTRTQTGTPSFSATITWTQTAAPTAQDTPSFSPTLTITPSATGTSSNTPLATKTWTQTATPSPQDPPLMSPTITPTPNATGILTASPTASPYFTPVPKDTDDIRIPNLGRQGGSNLVVQIKGVSEVEGPATLKAYVNGQVVDNVWSGNLSKNTTVIHWNPGDAVAPGTPFSLVLRREDGTTFRRTFVYVE